MGWGGWQWRNLYFTFQRLSAKDPIYLSVHIFGEMSEQRWGELGDKCTYCSVCAHPAHSILGNCSASKKKIKKKLSLFCHSASQVTFTANNLSGWKKGTKKKKTSHRFIKGRVKENLSLKLNN